MSDANDHPSFAKKICSSCLKIISSLFWLTWFILTVIVIAYTTVALLCMYTTQMKMEIIFSNRIRQPLFGNLSDCRSFGVVKCENLYLDGTAGKIGAWFISPSTQHYITREAYMLYLHGNVGSRAFQHRVEMYKKLSRMGYHVLAIDYRGFGDSDGTPTEHGVVEDAKVGYRYLKKLANENAIYIWGHSLGSAVGLQLASYLNKHSYRCNGVILEAPFNNMTDGIKYSPLAKYVIPFVPNFDSYVEDVKYVFRSDYWIQKVTTPTIMLHDVNDHILNINLARKLFQSAKSTGSSNVQMIELDENLYHNDIYKAKHFIKYISEFVEHTS